MANFGFAQQYAAPDYQTRAQAGVPLVGGDDALSAAAMQALNAPTPPQGQSQPQPQGQGAEPFKPSLWDVLQGWAFEGKSPAASGMEARSRYYQTAQQQMMMEALQKAPPQQRLAMLLNPGKLGEEYAKNFAPINAGEGTTETMFGGPGIGGGRAFTAPKMGFDPVSGRGYTQTPDATTPTGQSLGGGLKAENGLILSDRTGPVATYSTPVTVAPGSSSVPFTPTVGGPGALPQAGGPAPGRGAPAGGLVGPDGHLDPLAFFKGFTLPHEGGLNPRDLNGAPTKFGINQSANPGVDVSKITADDAANIFKNKYFAASGAANLPPALAAVHADTAFINPKKAMQFLTQSGGDPNKYMDLRDQWMGGLVKQFPGAQKYAQAWSQRSSDLRNLAGQLGQAGGDQSQSGQGGGFGAPIVHGKTPEVVPPGDPVYGRFPPGTVLQRAPTGELSVVQKPEYDPSAKSTIRDKVLSSPEYTQAKAAMSAYSAMVANADKMSGPSAYSMLDTFARAINPGAVARPTVIQTIEANLGLPAQLVGSLESKFGQGNLPPQVRQQIIDAVVPFAQAHWDQANMMNQANAALAQKHGFDPADVTAPLETRPERVQIAVPPPQQRPPGLYVTPKGPMKWDGKLWHPAP